MKNWFKSLFGAGRATSSVSKTIDYDSEDYMSAPASSTPRYRTVGDLGDTIGEVPTVFACVTMIARSFSSVNFFTVRGDDLTGKKINHPILKLIENPNPMMTKSAFLSQVSINWELSGNAFIYVHRVDGVPVGLYPLMTKYVKIVPGTGNNLVEGYVYSPKVKNGGIIDIPYTPDEILHISYPKPFDDLWGVAPLMCANDFLGLGTSAVSYVKSFFSNSSLPAGILRQESAGAKAMDNATYKRLVRRWDAIHGGTANAHKVAILEGGLDFKAINYNTRDIDLPSISGLSKDEIAMIFCVPPALLGKVSSGSHAALVTYRRLFWEDNIIPKIEQFVQLLNKTVMKDFRGKNVSIHIDTDSIEALRDSRKELCTTVALLFDRGLLTVNEARQAVKYPSVENGDERYHNSSLLPVGSGRDVGNAESQNNENINTDEATGIDYDAPQVNGGSE